MGGTESKRNSLSGDPQAKRAEEGLRPPTGGSRAEEDGKVRPCLHGHSGLSAPGPQNFQGSCNVSTAFRIRGEKNSF